MQSNTVNGQPDIASVVVTTADNQIIVPQPITTVVEVNSPGPQGAKGERGPIGPSAPFNEIVTNVWATTSSIEISGSLTVSGSNTFTNIGPAIFSGSVNVTGSIFNWNGNQVLTFADTGSITVLSASYAESSSYSITSSYSNTSTSASYTLTSSYSNTSTSASYALTASYANSASYALTSSYSNTSTSASFALTASNINPLYQNVYISGSTILDGNLTVFGTASYVYITASQLNVGTNTISVNVAEPAQRFGGLLVYDSGSFSHQATASLLWDSLNNRWVYQNASGSTYTGGMLLSGPRNTGSLGDEPSLTRFFVPRSDGGDHLNNTQIYSSASITQITGSLLVSGSTNGLDTTNGILTVNGQDKVNWAGGTLTTTTNINSVDWEGYRLYDNASNGSIDWNLRSLYTSVGSLSIDYENNTLNDLLSDVSVDWENRYLIYPGGASRAINFSTLNQIITTGSITSSGSLVTISSNTAPTAITSSAFIDDYNRVTLSPGGTPSLTYTNTNTGAGNATIVTNYLNIVNGNPAGVSYTTVPLSGFSAPYNATLASNTGNLIEWTFNLRTNRASIFSGFAAGQYGGAVVLVGSNANVQTLGQGYALIYGNTASRNWKLVKYNNGLQGTLTDVIAGGIFASNTSYVSVKITYSPSNNTWSYYFRDDGTGGWGDPATVSTLIGTAVDSTYTSTLMSVFGVYFNYSTAANQNLQFDNLTIRSYQTFSVTPQSMLTVRDSSNRDVFTAADTGAVTVSGSLIGYGGISGSFSGSYNGNGTALTLGQTGSSVFGTGVLSVTSAITTLTLIPGLTTTFTVPTGGTYMTYIATNGGINTTATTSTGVSAIDVAILVDGSILTAGGYNRMYADNPSANATVTNYVANWNMHVVTPLAAGSHTVTVNAAFVAGSTATVSGGTGTIKQGTLTIMILKAS